MHSLLHKCPAPTRLHLKRHPGHPVNLITQIALWSSFPGRFLLNLIHLLPLFKIPPVLSNREFFLRVCGGLENILTKIHCLPLSFIIII